MPFSIQCTMCTATFFNRSIYLLIEAIKQGVQNGQNKRNNRPTMYIVLIRYESSHQLDTVTLFEEIRAWQAHQLMYNI